MTPPILTPAVVVGVRGSLAPVVGGPRVSVQDTYEWIRDNISPEDATASLREYRALLRQIDADWDAAHRAPKPARRFDRLRRWAGR